MIYLLDTNICIHILKSRSLNVLKNAKRKTDSYFLISDITVGELWYGVSKSAKVQENEQNLVKFLQSFETLPFNAEHAREYGLLREEQRKKGKSIGLHDLMIAAQAINMEAVLVTANQREFSQIKDLRLENWPHANP